MFGAIACAERDSSMTGLARRMSCEENVTIEVSNGTTPSLPGSLGSVWEMTSSWGLFMPPVEYGAVQAAASPSLSPAQFLHGTESHVYVFSATGAGPSECGDSTMFTQQPGRTATCSIHQIVTEQK